MVVVEQEDFTLTIRTEKISSSTLDFLSLQSLILYPIDAERQKIALIPKAIEVFSIKNLPSGRSKK